MGDATHFSLSLPLPVPVTLSLYWLVTILAHLALTDPNPSTPPRPASLSTDSRANGPNGPPALHQDDNNPNHSGTAQVSEHVLVRLISSRKSILVTKLVFVTLPTVYFTLAVYFYHHPDNHTTLLSCPANPLILPILALIGISLSLVCFPLRLLCFSYLGSSFSFSLRPPRGGKLVTTGPYRYVRHPSYTTAYLGMLGLAMAFFAPGTVVAKCLLNDYQGWLGSIVATWLVLRMGIAIEWIRERVKKEDRLLEGIFGDEWRRYKQRTWALVPWVC